MPASDYSVGDVVRLRAGLYRRPNNGPVFFHGQAVELTDDELVRVDFDEVFEPLDVVEPASIDDDDEDEDGDNVPFDYADVSYEALAEMLDKATVKLAKTILSNELLNADAMQLALEAEQEGQNRPTLVQYIEGRLEQLREEEEDGSPS